MLCLVLFSFNRKHLPVSNVLQALWIFSKCSDFFFYDFLKTVPCPILLIHKKLWVTKHTNFSSVDLQPAELFPPCNKKTCKWVGLVSKGIVGVDFRQASGEARWKTILHIVRSNQKHLHFHRQAYRMWGMSLWSTKALGNMSLFMFYSLLSSCKILSSTYRRR